MIVLDGPAKGKEIDSACKTVNIPTGEGAVYWSSKYYQHSDEVFCYYSKLVYERTAKGWKYKELIKSRPPPEMAEYYSETFGVILHE